MMHADTKKALEFVRASTGATFQQVANLLQCDAKRAQIILKNLSACRHIKFIKQKGWVATDAVKPANDAGVAAPVYTTMGNYSGVREPARQGACDAFKLCSRVGNDFVPYTGPRAHCVSRVPGNGREERV